MKMIEVKDTKQLNSIQQKAVAGLRKSRAAMHDCLLLTLAHVAGKGQGDRMALQYLLDLLATEKADKGNLTKIKTWCEDFGGFIFEEKKHNIVGWQGHEFIQARFEAARDNPWYDYKKASNFDGFDLDKALLKVLKNRDSMVKKLPDLSPEDQKKIDLTVSKATLTALLAAIGLDAALEGEAEEVLRQAA